MFLRNNQCRQFRPTRQSPGSRGLSTGRSPGTRPWAAASRRRWSAHAWRPVAGERLSKGIYRLGGAPPTWRQKLLATCFAAGPDAVAAHLAAAALHHLPAGRTRLEITVPEGRRFRRDNVIATRAHDCLPWTWRRL